MARSTLQHALTAAAVVLLVGGPVGAANREHQQMMADLRILQEQTQQLQLQLAALAESLKVVTAKLDDQSGNNRKAFADQKLLVDAVSGDLRVVREKVDDNNVRITSLSQELEALRLAIPPATAVQPTAPGAGTDASAGAPGTAPATTAQPSPASLGVSPQRLFDTAWADYTAGQWTLAIEGFETYIKTFPKSDRAGEAQYYVGETHFNDGKFNRAVAAYDKAVIDYPGNKKTAEAYYKRGLALERLGQVQRARESYDYVVKSFPPDNQVAGLARQALDRLNRSQKD